MKFKDDSGEIQAVAFLEFDFKLDDILQLGALYEISNATVQKAYKAKNRYEMLINQNTKVVLFRLVYIKIQKFAFGFVLTVIDKEIIRRFSNSGFGRCNHKVMRSFAKGSGFLY